MTFAPEGGYGGSDSQSVFTHGAELGVSRNESHDLQTATDEILQALSRSNPRLRRESGYDRISVGGRQGVRTNLSNQNEVTGRSERAQLYTALLNDGTLFYMIGVAPENEFGTYDGVFDRVAKSLQFAR